MKHFLELGQKLHLNTLLSLNHAAMSACDGRPPLTADIRHGRSDQRRGRRAQHRGRCLYRHASKNGLRMQRAASSRGTHAQQRVRQRASADAAHAKHERNATARSSGADSQFCSRHLEASFEAGLPPAWLRPSTEVERAGSGCKQVICRRCSADTGREVRHHTAGSGRSAHRRVSLPDIYVVYHTGTKDLGTSRVQTAAKRACPALVLALQVHRHRLSCQ